MNTKLTLTIEQSLIDKAKRYAKDKGRSLSDLVENYFKLLADPSQSEAIEISPKVRSLMGSFKLLADFDYKEALKEEINKKHA